MPVLQHRLAAQLLCPAEGFSHVAFRGDIMAGIATVASDPDEDDDTAEIGLLVLDRFQREGIGSALLTTAASKAAGLGFRQLVMSVHPANKAVLPMVGAVDLRAKVGMHDGLVRVTLSLSGRSHQLRWRAS
jgi:GNAT superfamily N-acetyltransferase